MKILINVLIKINEYLSDIIYKYNTRESKNSKHPYNWTLDKELLYRLAKVKHPKTGKSTIAGAIGTGKYGKGEKHTVTVWF